MLSPGIMARLAGVTRRYDELTAALASPDAFKDRNQFRDLAKEHAGLEEVAQAFRRYEKATKEHAENEELAAGADDEIRAMARDELAALDGEIADLENRLRILLLPKDPNDSRNTYLEIRGGAGGEESLLFAADLFRMYTRFAERQGWSIEVQSRTDTGLGGLKELTALITGKDVYAQLKYESGVHRVQRVPATEAQGRIHTSTATVAVLPEVDDVEVEIDEKDIRIDVYRSSGPGGQSVNTTDSAVRITHLPTGLVVACQDEKSQHKNKSKAMKILRARLYEQALRTQQEQISADRRNQIGSGDRSEKIRTYNFPQGRVTDHRIHFTSYRLPDIMDGDLDELITQCRTFFQAQQLAAFKEPAP